MPIYNKLVRDRIPEVIRQNEKQPITRILDIEEYKTELQKKLGEEMKEYLQAATDKEAVEELADLLELIHAAAGVHGSSVEGLEKVRVKKAEDRGGFMDRVFLIEVKDA